MPLHYRPIVFVCCSCLDLVEQTSKVSWVVQDELVVVEMEVEAIKQEVSRIEVSNLAMGYSTEDVE